MERPAQSQSCCEPMESWGISGLDAAGGGLIAKAFNMLSAPGHRVLCAIAAHFVAKALDERDRAVIVALDNANLLLRELTRFGFDFEGALHEERLVYLYYKPAFRHSFGLSADYAALFGEIRRLAGDVRRVALLNADLLFNLQSQHLADASVSSAVAAAGQFDFTVLGCYVPQASEAHRYLDASCSNLMPLYVTGTPLTGARPRRYRLAANKRPGAEPCPVLLDLDAEHEPIRVISCAEIA